MPLFERATQPLEFPRNYGEMGMRDPERVALGRRLVEARGTMSQAKMAAELGVDRVTLSFYENGKTSLPAAIIAEYVRRGWSAHWLITGDGAAR